MDSFKDYTELNCPPLPSQGGIVPDLHGNSKIIFKTIGKHFIIRITKIEILLLFITVDMNLDIRNEKIKK